MNESPYQSPITAPPSRQWGWPQPSAGSALLIIVLLPLYIGIVIVGAYLLAVLLVLLISRTV